MEIVDIFNKYNVDFVSLNESFDTSTPSGMAFLQITGVFAELERSMISQRTKEALREKKNQGVILGQPTKINKKLKDNIISMRRGRKSWKCICKSLNISFVTAKKCLSK